MKNTKYRKYTHTRGRARVAKVNGVKDMILGFHPHVCQRKGFSYPTFLKKVSFSVLYSVESRTAKNPTTEHILNCLIEFARKIVFILSLLIP